VVQLHCRDDGGLGRAAFPRRPSAAPAHGDCGGSVAGRALSRSREAATLSFTPRNKRLIKSGGHYRAAAGRRFLSMNTLTSETR
jgi:hypothetical protein